MTQDAGPPRVSDVSALIAAAVDRLDRAETELGAARGCLARALVLYGAVGRSRARRANVGD